MILTAGLSPVLQQVLLSDALALGEVNRARDVSWCASGKVLNAARALHHLGAPGKALSAVGGSTGDAVRRDFARLGLLYARGGRWGDQQVVPAAWVEESLVPGEASDGAGRPTLVVISLAGGTAVAPSLAGVSAGATTTSGRARLDGGASSAGTWARCGGTLKPAKTCHCGTSPSCATVYSGSTNTFIVVVSGSSQTLPAPSPKGIA